MKYILVTGAGGGMGRATVDMLHEQGYGVFALDVKATEARDGIIPLVADITNEASLTCAFEQVSGITKQLHAIVHLAGIYLLDSLVEIPEQDFLKAFDINLFGVYRINKIFRPLLQKGSRIVITTSELAPLDPLPFTGLYSITKSALDKYAASLRMELQLLGISVAVLRPGAVRTGMLGVSTDQLDRFCAKTQLYACNARKFHQVVDRVEARNVHPDRVASRICRMMRRKRIRPVYHLNRNPLLLLLNILPTAVQLWIIKQILK